MVSVLVAHDLLGRHVVHLIADRHERVGAVAAEHAALAELLDFGQRRDVRANEPELGAMDETCEKVRPAQSERVGIGVRRRDEDGYALSGGRRVGAACPTCAAKRAGSVGVERRVRGEVEPHGRHGGSSLPCAHRCGRGNEQQCGSREQ